MRKTAQEKLAYFIGILTSFVVHLVLAVLAIVAFERSAATASRPVEIFTVTLEGGERLGGITQIPKADAKEVKPPEIDALPEDEPEDGSEEEDSGSDTEKKLESPSVVEDPEAVLAKKRAEEEAKKKEEADKKRKEEEAKKKAAEEKRKKAEAEKKKKEEEKKAKARERRRRKKRLADAAKRFRTGYQGESYDAGGTGFGAARTGGSGMGGGTLASVEKIAYQAELQEHVKAGWRWLPGGKRLRARIRVGILPSGIIQSVRIEQSSGNANFDDSVVRAVRKASPVPPPPEKYYGDFSDVRFWFDSHEQ